MILTGTTIATSALRKPRASGDDPEVWNGAGASAP